MTTRMYVTVAWSKDMVPGPDGRALHVTHTFQWPYVLDEDITFYIRHTEFSYPDGSSCSPHTVFIAPNNGGARAHLDYRIEHMRSTGWKKERTHVSSEIVGLDTLTFAEDFLDLVDA